MSQLQNKSQILVCAAKLLHKNSLYPAVAHSAYYSCLQLLKHIWLYNIGKTEVDLTKQCKNLDKGTHEVLINEIGSYIKKSSKIDAGSDFRLFNNKIGQLKKLRNKADYEDSMFDDKNSAISISLSDSIIPILKKY